MKSSKNSDSRSRKVFIILAVILIIAGVGITVFQLISTQNAKNKDENLTLTTAQSTEVSSTATAKNPIDFNSLIKKNSDIYAWIKVPGTKVDYPIVQSKIDDDFYEELEETLIMGDLGVRATMDIIEDLKVKVKEQHIKEPIECRQLVIDSIREQMDVGETAYEFENRQSVVFVIGVNGVGKTTTIGKLAGKLKAQNKKVILAAADTFRAAAGEQLKEWSNRAGVEMIGGQEGADPASVVYDAVAAAKARRADVLLCDTAGRLHNKKNLMEELKKINRVIDREYPDAFRETLVVLDATTGQNALAQAKEFNEVTDITGIVLTKMDGTAKGGIAVAIQSELGIPVKYIGVGETIDDLQKFDSEEFVNALFYREEERP